LNGKVSRLTARSLADCFHLVVKHVYLVDVKRPESFDLIYKAVIEVAPWVVDKVRMLSTTFCNPTIKNIPEMVNLCCY
jgi:hypothetical protein